MTIDYGYIRVSSKEQKTDRQMDSLLHHGLEASNIYVDKISGKDFNRPQYLALLRKLQRGDTIIVCSIDRLGRDYEEILEQWRFIFKQKCTNIAVLDMPLLDTRCKGADLTGILVSDLVLQILSYVAEAERINIRKRQSEGIASAQARGIHFGRPRMDLPENFYEIATAWRHGKYPAWKAASLLGVSRSWFYRRVSELKL